MRTLLALAVVGLLIMGCGEDSEPTVGTPDVVGEATADVEADTASPMDCPIGQVLGSDGSCIVIGIQGCADIFINPDTGLCDPKPEHCPAGQISNFSEGCTPVGIQGCAEMFIDPESGFCDPRPEHCPPGQIPNFSEGCTPVGIPDCAEMFIDPESGLCDPDPDLCGEGFIPVPSQGCVSLDPPGGCGEGTWGNIEELPGDTHVDSSYAGGDSDGTREKPYTNTTTAYDNTAAGSRMVLAAGDYDKGILIKRSVSIIGRCNSMVTISGVRNTQLGPVVLKLSPFWQGVDVTISDLRISGPGIGLVASLGPQVVLSRMVFDGNQGLGLLVYGGATSVTVTDTLIARTQPSPDGTFGRGIEIWDGASLTLNRVAITKNHLSGLYATGAGTSVSATDTLIARTQPSPNGAGGQGIEVHQGASLTFERSALVENHSIGLRAEEDGTSVTATHSLIARTQPRPDGIFGLGIVAFYGASLTLDRTALVENHESALVTSDIGTSVSVKDTLIARTQLLPDGTFGRGIEVYYGASLTLERSAVVENNGLGLLAQGSETSVIVMDTLIARTQPMPDGVLGRGIQVQQDASLTLDHSAVVENHEAAIFFSSSPIGEEVVVLYGSPPIGGEQLYSTTGSITNSLLADTLPTERWGFGDGLLVSIGAVVDVHGVIARGNARAGILYDKSSGELEDCLSTENQVGMVVQGLWTEPITWDTNVFQGNEVNLILDGNFKIPDEAIAIPPSPKLWESDG